jgi:hypothetical protein
MPPEQRALTRGGSTFPHFCSERYSKKISIVPETRYRRRGRFVCHLVSRHSRRAYEHGIEAFITWYWSELRLGFNRSIVARRYRSFLESPALSSATVNLHLSAIRRLTDEAVAAGDSAIASTSAAPGPRATRRSPRSAFCIDPAPVWRARFNARLCARQQATDPCHTKCCVQHRLALKEHLCLSEDNDGQTRNSTCNERAAI